MNRRKHQLQKKDVHALIAAFCFGAVGWGVLVFAPARLAVRLHTDFGDRPGLNWFGRGNCAAMLIFSAFGLAWAVRTLRTLRRAESGKCPVCGYDLRGSSDRCPECGTPISKN